jgi:hypothetical protein
MVMKISNQTVKILKNFSKINPTILVRSGKNLVTIDHNKRIIADANVDETMPVDFAIHDLNQFLTVVSLFESPDFEFKSDRVVVKNNHKKINYIFADQSCVTDAKVVRDKIPMMFKTEDIVQSFVLSESDLKSITETATILKYPHITFVGDTDGVRVVARDTNNDSLGDFVINLNIKSNSPFEHTMLLDNLRVLSGDYDVSISPNIAHFVNKSFPIRYWIVMEAV